MELVRNLEDISKIQENHIYLDNESFYMKNSKISFTGKNNILFCDGTVKLNNCNIRFEADNSILYLSNSKYYYMIDIMLNNNNTCYFGNDCYFNGVLHVLCSEEKNVLIGKEGLFSFGIWIRTADPHLIYSSIEHKRINLSKSVYIGDHVWLGQDVFIMKNSKIHSGSIIGARSVVAGKVIFSNTSNAGNPVREIANNVFWDRPCVHKWTEKDTTENILYDNDDFIFTYDECNHISFDQIENDLCITTNKLEYLKNISKEKNRFSLASNS